MWFKRLMLYFFGLSTVYLQIFVGGLGPNVKDEDLRQPFSQYGEIVSVKIPVRRGCGFVQFANRYNSCLKMFFFIILISWTSLHLKFCGLVTFMVNMSSFLLSLAEIMLRRHCRNWMVRQLPIKQFGFLGDEIQQISRQLLSVSLLFPFLPH